MSNELPAPPPLLIDDSDDLFGRPSRGTWMMIITMLIVKIGALVIVFSIDRSTTAAMYAIVASWFWILMLAIVLSGPITYAWRVRRVRARKAALQRSEWIID